MPTEVEEQPWTTPTWEQVAPRFQELFPDIDADEIRRRYEGARDLGQWRYRLRGAEETNTTAFLRSTDPFGVLAGRNAGALREASERMAQGRPGEGDAETIAVQERLQELDQNRGTASTIGRTVLGGGTYAAEYLAGGALIRSATGAVRGASALSNPSALSALGGMVGRAAVIGAPRAWSATEQRRLPEQQRDEEGHAVGLPSRESRSFVDALPAGAFDSFTEAFTEQLGGTRAFRAAGRVPGALLERIGLGRARGFISAGMTSRLERAGVHGIVGEIGEERAGEIMRGVVLGDLMGERDTYGTTGQAASAVGATARGDLPAARQHAGNALHQLFVEGAAFTIIQGGAHGLGHIMNARQGTPEAALRTQIEAEVQRQQATPQRQTSERPQTAHISELPPPNAELAAAEAQINQRLSGQQTLQVQEPQQQAQPEQEQPPEAPQSPVAEPVLPEAQAPIEEPQAQTASEPARPQPAIEDVRGIARQLGLDARGGLRTLTSRIQGAGGQGLLEDLTKSATIADRPTERRQDMAKRVRLDQMTREQLLRVVATSQLTGLPNRRAFDEADPAPAVAMSDADGLKAFNDRFGYEAGNALLKAKAEALRAAGLDAYHEKGDEFLYRGANPAEIGQKLERARALLRESFIEVTLTDGTVKRFKGADFSYGVGNDLKSSEAGLKTNKAEREARGERARGELRGIVEVGPEASQVGQGDATRRKGLAALRRKQSGPVAKPEGRQYASTSSLEAFVGRAADVVSDVQRPLNEAEQEIMDRRRMGQGLRKIAASVGVSHEKVRQIVAKVRNTLGMEPESRERLGLKQKRQVQAERGEVSAETNWGESLSEEDREAERMVGEFLASKPQEIEDAVKALQASGLSAEAARRRAEEVASEEFQRGVQAEQAAEAKFGQPVSAAERQAGSLAGGQADAAGAVRPPRTTALANVVTREERAENKLPPIEQAARLEDASVWDEAMQKLADDPQASVRLVEELNKKPRATTVQENALLAHRRVTLANEHERATNAYIIEFRKLKQADPAKLNELDVRERWLLNEIDQTDKAIVKAGTEWGRSGRWRRMLVAEDVSLAGMLLRAEAAKGRPLTDAEKKEVLELNRKIAKLQKLLEEAIEAGKVKPGAASDLDWELTKAKAEFDRKVRADREGRDPWKVKAMRLAGEAASIPKSLMAMIDLPIGRQGLVGLITHPIRTIKAAPEALKAMVSEDAANRAIYDIHHDPDVAMYLAAGGEITDATGPLSHREEGFFSRWLGKVPVLGSVGRASNRIHQTWMNRIRFDSFKANVQNFARPTIVDRLAAKAFGWKEGEITTHDAKVLANYSNVMTGRGHLGETGEKAIVLLNATFFAPKYVASRFQMVLGQPLWTFQAGLSPRARWLVAKEYGRLLAAFGTMVGLAIAAGWDFEKDPRSSDFGKLKTGDTRIDVTGGLASVTTFLARSAPFVGGVKTREGAIRPQTASDIGGFLRQKLAPVPGAALSLKTGRDAINRPITPAQVGLQTTTPLFFNDVLEALQAQGIPKGTALSLLALMGMSMNTYGRR